MEHVVHAIGLKRDVRSKIRKGWEEKRFNDLKQKMQLDGQIVDTMHAITHKQVKTGPQGKAKWVYKEHVPRRVQSVKSIVRINEKNNLNLHTELVSHDDNIFKANTTKGCFRGWSLQESNEHRRFQNMCIAKHRTLLDKQKERNELKVELQALNKEFYKVEKQVVLYRAQLGRLNEMAKQTQHCLSNV